MKGWLIALAVLLLVGAFVANSVRENQIKREAKAAWRSQMRDEVHSLARKWNVNQGWEKQLAGPDGNRIADVMSAELQRLWSGDSPILFVGTLEDISKQPDGSFELLVTHDGLISSRLFIMSSIQLRAACPESVGNRILAAHTKDSTGFFPGVAVVARITDVAQESTRATSQSSGHLQAAPFRCRFRAHLASAAPQRRAFRQRTGPMAACGNWLGREWFVHTWLRRIR